MMPVIAVALRFTMTGDQSGGGVEMAIIGHIALEGITLLIRGMKAKESGQINRNNAT